MKHVDVAGPNQDELSVVFRALADSTRRGILERLSEGPATVGELGQPFAISKPAISRHLKVLGDAGLITREVDAQWRLCRLRPEPLTRAVDWIEHHRHLWSERFDRLEAQLLRALPHTSPPDSNASPTDNPPTDNPPTDHPPKGSSHG